VTPATGANNTTIAQSAATGSLTSGNGTDLVLNQYNNSRTTNDPDNFRRDFNNGATSIGLTKSGLGFVTLSNNANSFTGPRNGKRGHAADGHRVQRLQLRLWRVEWQSHNHGRSGRYP